MLYHRWEAYVFIFIAYLNSQCYNTNTLKSAKKGD